MHVCSYTYLSTSHTTLAKNIHERNLVLVGALGPIAADYRHAFVAVCEVQKTETLYDGVTVTVPVTLLATPLLSEQMHGNVAKPPNSGYIPGMSEMICSGGNKLRAAWAPAIRQKVAGKQLPATARVSTPT